MLLNLKQRFIICILLLDVSPQFAAAVAKENGPIDLGSRRELFVDRYLIDHLDGAARLKLHEPHDEGKVMDLDQPWEGAYSGYMTIIKDGDLFRLYYRGAPDFIIDQDGFVSGDNFSTCYAESKDGTHWSKPNLDMFRGPGDESNTNIVVRHRRYSNNFVPLLDTKPGIPPNERYKALSFAYENRLENADLALIAHVSEDGIHWRKLREEPVIRDPGPHAFDSPNVAFWSETEQQYVCYYRKTVEIRSVSRITSPDFIHWSAPEMMTYSDTGTTVPSQEIYIHQTQPYFRAPHVYVATAARYCPGRGQVTAEQGKQLKLHWPKVFLPDTSDVILMTTRGGADYDRTFLSALIKPGFGLSNWVGRTNYPVLNVVQTSPTEMSLYLNCNYAQDTSHVRRYSMRLDGFASLSAPFEGGEMVTKPIIFTGKTLFLNCATSAAGEIGVEIQDAAGKPIPQFALADCIQVIGNEIDRAVAWKDSPDIGQWAGKPVRLRFVLKDADLYSFQFR